MADDKVEEALEFIQSKGYSIREENPQPENVTFLYHDSPLEYARSANVKRIALCDSSVSDAPIQGDIYFAEKEQYRRTSKSGKRLKKPILEEIIPGVDDNCIIGFLDTLNTFI